MQINIGEIEVKFSGNKPKYIFTIIRSIYWGVVLFGLCCRVYIPVIIFVFFGLIVTLIFTNTRTINEYIKSIVSTIIFPIVVIISYIYYSLINSKFLYLSYVISLIILFVAPKTTIGLLSQINVLLTLLVIILRIVYFSLDAGKLLVNNLYKTVENIIAYIGKYIVTDVDNAKENKGKELLKDFFHRLLKRVFVFGIVKSIASPTVLYISTLCNWFMLVIVTIISFSVSYRALSYIDPGYLNVNSHLSVIDSIYFSTVTIVGSGETNISPVSQSAKLLVIFELFYQVLIIVILFSILTTSIENRIKISKEQIENKEKEMQDSLFKEIIALTSELKNIKQTKEDE